MALERNAAVEIDITLVYSPGARVVREFVLTVPAGTTLAQAISRWQSRYLLDGRAPDGAALNAALFQWGIWGKAAEPEQILKPHDRIELYRALTVDPKTARRQRFKQQGTKGAGLFAARRSGGKAGY